MTRLYRCGLALLAVAATVLAGPIGTGGVAAAAGGGAQESRLEGEIDRLSNGQRAQLERGLADRLAEAGVDLEDPAIQARLAGVLGVTRAEIGRAVEGSREPAGPVSSSPVLFLFLAAALVFAPSAFRSIAATLFDWAAEQGGIEGIEGLR